MIRDINTGKLMVVSDLHGNGHDFRQILKTFNKLKQKNLADTLVFLGDLVHAYPGKQKDESYEIVKELIQLRTNEKDSDVICLLGNHEFVHIYHIPLAKGHLEFTSWFENRIRKNREEVVEFFMQMPLMLRTFGGVLINHTGASDRYVTNNFLNLEGLKAFKHADNFSTHIKKIDQYDPYIGSEFMDTELGDFLWDILMNGNERQYGENYNKHVDDLLNLMSADRLESPLNVLVCGHIASEYGAELVGNKQLRICTSAGALGDLEKKYAMVDAKTIYKDGNELMDLCNDLY